MAGSGVSLYSTTASGNKTVIGTIDWREDVYMPSQINDNLAQIMADIRAMANAVATGWIEIGDGDGTYTATYVSATSFRFDGVNVASYYRAGMRVRVVAPTPGTLSGTITSSVFSTHTTLVVAWDSGQLSNEAITSVSLGIGSGGGSGAAASYRNILGRNGSFEVWQRGAGGAASFAIAASTARYTADGWWFGCGANQASVVSQQGGSTGSQWCAALGRNAGQTGVGAMVFEFPLDGDEIASMRGQIVTLSLNLSAGATWSPVGGTLTVALLTGTGAPARASLGFTGQVTVVSGTPALTAILTRYSYTSSIVVPTNATQASVYLTWTPVGTAGASDYFVIDDVQLEIGAATPFERRPFEQELLACKRHYWKTFQYSEAPVTGLDTAAQVHFNAPKAGAVTMYSPSIRFPVAMRAVPTLTLYGTNTSGQVRNRERLADHTSTASAALTSENLILSSIGNVSGVAGDLCGITFAVDAGI